MIPLLLFVFGFAELSFCDDEHDVSSQAHRLKRPEIHYNLCPCQSSENAEQSISEFSEKIPYNSFFSSAIPEELSHKFTPIKKSPGRSVVAITQKQDLLNCLEEGDVLVYIRPVNERASSNNVLNHVQQGTSHAAIVLKDKDGKPYHMDSPQGYGGPYNFSGPFQIIKLKKDAHYNGKSKKEVIEEIKKRAAQIKGKYQYDGTLTTDIYQMGSQKLGLLAAAASQEQIISAGCQAMCQAMDQGRCPPQYCSELVYTLFATSGVNLKAESLSDIVKRLDKEILQGLSESERNRAMESFITRLMNSPDVQAVMGEEQATTQRQLLRQLMAPETPDMIRAGLEKIKGPIFFPHNFVTETKKENGPFCYAGTYFGRGYSSGRDITIAETAATVPPSPQLITSLHGHTLAVSDAQFSPDGKKIVTVSDDRTAKIWATETGALEQTLNGHNAYVRSAQFSPDSKKIVTASSDGTAKIWATETGALEQTLNGHNSWVRSAQFSPDGKKIVTVSGDATAKIWATETGALERTLNGHNAYVRSAQFSPDGKKIVTASDDGTAKIWATETGDLEQTLNGHTDWVNSAKFSPDGKKIVTASDDGTAKIWATETGDLEQTLNGHTRFVKSAQFSPDGKKIVTASNDETAKIWATETGDLEQTLNGHTRFVKSAQFSPDGKKIVTASDDGTAKIWATETGDLEQTLNGHNSWVRSAQFSPDGKKIVTASNDETAKIWAAKSVPSLTREFIYSLYRPELQTQNTTVDAQALEQLNNEETQNTFRTYVRSLHNYSNFTREDVYALINGEIDTVAVQNRLKNIVNEIIPETETP